MSYVFATPGSIASLIMPGPPDPPKNATATVVSIKPDSASTPGSLWVNVTPPDPPAGAPVDWKPPASYEILARPTLTLHSAAISTAEEDGGVLSFEISGLETGATYSFDVRSVDKDGTKSSDVKTTNAAKVPTKPISWLWNWSSFGIGALFAIAGLATFLFVNRHSIGHSLGYGFWVVAAGVWLLTAVGWSGGHGFWTAVIGADNRISTSYLTTGMWTLLVAFALAYFTARTWFYGQHHLFDGFLQDAEAGKQTTGTDWDQYLILLGGPFAALVIARGVVSTKVQNQTVQKTIADDGSASLTQAVTGDTGSVDLVDSQYVLFNIVALGYVIVGLASKNQLPTIPAALLALTSTSAATYVLNKTVQNDSPTVTAVVPSSFRPGDSIVITGTNFMPAGPGHEPIVTIGGSQALVNAGSTDGRLTAVVPPGLSAGAQSLVVTTAARASSEARTVQVLQDAPQILSINPPSPRIGHPMTISGAGFISALDPTHACSVQIGAATTVSADPKTGNAGVQELTFDVPNSVAEGPQAVVVTTSRLTTSQSVTVEFVT